MLTFQDTLEILNREIQAIQHPKTPAGLYEPIAYLLALKGKKLRPAFTLLACNLYLEEVDAAIHPALAWEIFHNFTLMHDDLMDKAELRRGQPTVHKKWNENTAILSGDAMLILSYIFMAKSPAEHLKPLLDLFSGTASEICKGQQYDMEFERRTDVSEREYIEMIRLKTAVMLGACLRSGAMIGGADKTDGQNLYDFGIHLGIAFQIKDDLLDVYGNPNVFGKKTGGDILCNKKTYLLINAMNSANATDKAELLRWLACNNQPEEKIVAVRSLYDKLSVPEKADETIRIFYEKALTALQAVSVDENRKKILRNITEELMKREF
ncbi:MAG: polyprenyl synthetase family protein [Dysgonamonadaceae bacterium]|jgi:geranylgeranyl diphosphate synthase type II|nr:polyprenyl synthetase family protein [Dysgonamonadaceae bacterium]